MQEEKEETLEVQDGMDWMKTMPLMPDDKLDLHWILQETDSGQRVQRLLLTKEPDVKPNEEEEERDAINDLPLDSGGKTKQSEEKRKK